MRSARIELILDTLRGVRGAKELSKATDDVAKSLGETERKGKAAGDAIDHAGDEMSESARAAAGLDREIEKLTGSLRGMAIQQALTGESFTKQIREQESQVRRLTRNRKLLGDPEEQAAGFVAQLQARLGPLITKMPIGAPLAAVLGGAAIAAAPMIGATISAAIIGGAGVGGVLGGIALVSKDARVEAAGKALGEKLLAGLQGDASPFIRPVLAAADLIGSRFDEMRNQIQSIFRNAAQFVAPLTDGLTRGIQRVVGGFDALVAKAGPVIDVISQGFADVGDAIGDVFTELSKNGNAAAVALQGAFDAVTGTIRAVGFVVDKLSEAFGFLAKLGAFGHDAQQQMIALEVSGKLATGAAVDMGESFQKAADKSAMLAQQQELLKAANDRVSAAQKGLQDSLNSLGGATSQQGQRATNLKQAMDNLFGATIRQADANQTFEASWDSLSESVKGSSRSLDIHTQAGRTNRDALKGLLASSNDLYIANIAAGDSVALAARKHRDRTEAVRKESVRLGLNKTETQNLINTYGRIPAKKTTDLVLDGMKSVATALEKLYRLQRALALGININLVEGTGTVKAFKAAGGPIEGPGARGVDSVHIMAAPGEHMLTANEVAKAGGHDAVYAWRRQIMDGHGLPGYAKGGQIARVDTSRRWPFVVDVADSEIMSRREAESKVIPALPAGGQTLGFITRVVRAAFPGLAQISGYRPGARTLSGAQSLHAVKRAADYPASRPLAEWWNLHYLRQTKEFISPWNDLNILNGRRHSYSGAVYRQHNFAGGNAHDHIAMNRGGVIREPVFGYGASGRSYSFGERGRPETVIPGVHRPGGTTVVLNVYPTPLATPADIGRTVVGAIKAYDPNVLVNRWGN